MTDPFGTAELRAGLIQAWKRSPTRLIEDAATEADHVRGGYRDRVFTELVQNAADAAVRAGVSGRVQVWASNDAIHVANTGAPLDRAGVEALASLRASRKESGSVGRFGVGFTSVLALSDDIEVRSVSGSVRFSAHLSRAEITAAGIVGANLPVLRLVWPVEGHPAEGFSTEVVLRVAPSAVAGILAQFAEQATDLLLELLSIESVLIAGQQYLRAERDLGDGFTEVAIRDRTWWQYQGPHARWLVPIVAGHPAPAQPDVLRAPTRSDEELTLPVLVIGSPQLQPDRRRILPGAGLRHLMDGYGEFAAALPADDRLIAVPRSGFARSEVDSILREAAFAELRSSAWLPVVGTDVPAKPEQVFALPGLTGELASVLEDTIGGLLHAELSGRHQMSALRAVGVHEVGIARLADLLRGADREPAWWRSLYDALEPLVVDAVSIEELGAISVPLADGRTVTGPRTALLPGDLPDDPAVAEISWARLIHRDAVHPLLARLGAKPVTAADLLNDPVLEQLLIDGADVAEAVLVLAAAVGAEELPSWLGLVEIRDAEGNLRPADELLLPDAPLLSLLAPDAPFGTVDPELVRRFGPQALRKLGVGWSFLIVRDETPTGPDHDLADEDRWWRELDTEPEVLAAVRDLDLIDDEAWPRAIAQLMSEPATAALLADRGGYTAWWIRHYATTRGERFGTLCRPADALLSGLLDVYPDEPVVGSVLASLDDLEPALAQLLVNRLSDAARTPTPAAVIRVHAVLARAVAERRLDPADIDLPNRVRAADGSLIDADQALVLDKPIFAAAVPLDRLVVGSIDAAGALAQLLDLPLVSEVVAAEIVSEGTRTTWAAEPELAVAAAVQGTELPDGPVVLHDDLVVTLRGAIETTVSVPEWVDDAGVRNLSRRR